ncbi:histidine--tRNA ligase [candidate division TM6 bacterium RIFCSPHIGHO2_12_FULL_36_22]|nr:MAG: histidine--tRNA ligase [candidate division TM6 bacterium RIFCSPHIGHO2_12_FULL_36_22]
MNKIKGTQDFIDLQLFNFIIDKARQQCEQYNFSEIATPILEPTELFKRSLGTETDVVSKEMYTVNTGPDGDNICLRPEATASTIRAFIENSIQHTPWKVFSWGAMFRHERPQKGRYRQFHQFNLEVIGSNAIAEDALCIKMLDSLFSDSFGLSEYALIINFLGTPEERHAYVVILDKYLDGVIDKACKTCAVRKVSNILRVFDCKNETCQSLYKKAPKIIDHLTESAEEWQQLQEQLTLLSVSYTIDPKLVRGLDYYSKTVFEFVSSNLGSQNAFCGGGRYNNLVKTIGGKEDQPSIGASIGIERLMMVLEPIKDKLALPQPAALTILIPLAVEQQTLALLIAQNLHTHKLSCDILFEGSVKSMMRKANKMGATYTVLLGSDEQVTRTATVKNMITGTEEKMDQTKLAQYLKKV